MLSLRVALRYLFAPKSHAAVNVISAISVAGVAVATLAIVCVLSVFNGFTDLAADRLSVLDPSLKITPADGKVIAGADNVAATVVNSAGDAVNSVSAIVEEHSLAIYGGRQLTVRVKGVDSLYNTSRLEPAVIDGEFALERDSHGHAPATIGVGAAISLGAHPGYYDWLRLYTPRRRGRINPAAPMTAFRGDSVMVSGVFQLNQAEYDNDLVIVPVDVARRLLDYTDEATALEVELRDDADAGAVARSLRDVLGSDYVVSDRLQQQSATYRMIEVEKWVTLALLVFILAIASFNIVSTLSMLVIEKRGDIATYYALGSTRGFVGRVFFDQGFLISAVGSVSGILLGVGLCLLQQHFGLIKLGGDPSQLSVTTYPVRVSLSDLAVILAVSAAVSAAVGLVARSIAGSSMPGRRQSSQRLKLT